MFLEGDTIKGIKRELERQAIPSPRGLNHWPEPTIWGILVDSVNFGEYRALRRENTEPKERRGKLNGNPTYGKTSSRKVPGIVLPNIEIDSPVITREEHEWIMKRLAKNRLNSRRNGKHNFLLKGMVHYELDGRRYHGRLAFQVTIVEVLTLPFGDDHWRRRRRGWDRRGLHHRHVLGSASQPCFLLLIFSSSSSTSASTHHSHEGILILSIRKIEFGF